MIRLSSLDQRQLEAELMDDPELPEREHWDALCGLGRINRLTGSASLLYQPLRKYLRSAEVRKLRILDIGCGDADVSLRLCRRLQRANLEVELTGVDVSPRAVRYAQKRAGDLGIAARFERLDATRDPLPEGHDVVFNSLFLHHLTNQQACDLLTKMAVAARHLVLVSDLVRSRLNLLLVMLAARILTRSAVVQFDGPQSIRAAFTLEELRGLAKAAGLQCATVHQRPPCRALLAWRRS